MFNFAPDDLAMLYLECSVMQQDRAHVESLDYLCSVYVEQ
jgi:hypothetical protein